LRGEWDEKERLKQELGEIETNLQYLEARKQYKANNYKVIKYERLIQALFKNESTNLSEIEEIQ